MILGLVVDRYPSRLTVVNNLAFAALALQCALEHLHRQSDLAICACRHLLQRPGYNTVSLCTFVVSRHERYVLVQLVFDDYISFFRLVVPVADLIGDFVADLHAAQHSCAFIRRSLCLHGLLGHRVLDSLHTVLSIVADLHSCRFVAVHDLAFAALALQRALEHFHRQSDLAICACRDVLNLPGHDAALMFAIVARGHKLYVLVQRILDGDCSSLSLVILVADFVGDLVAHLDTAEFAGAFIRRDLLLVRFFGHGVLDGFHTVLSIVADLYCRSFAAVYDLAFAAVRLLSAFQYLDRQRDLAFLTSRHFLHCPDDRMVFLHISALVISVDTLNIRVELILDRYVSSNRLVVLIADFVGDLVADLHAAEDAGTFVRRLLFLVRFFRYGVHDFFHMVDSFIIDLYRCRLTAVHDLTFAALAL